MGSKRGCGNNLWLGEHDLALSRVNLMIPLLRVSSSMTTTTVPKTTYWVTRDSSPETGEPYQEAKVWLSAPNRYTVGNGAFWLGPNLELDHFATWALVFCQKQIYTIPDDDRQSIRVEGDTLPVQTRAPIVTTAKKVTA
jgi:hypothetical protein